MALGKQLVNSILSTEINKSANKHVKGVFTNDRNYKIACRFYYHFSIKGLQYERALSELNKEFDLSELRIAQIVMLERDNLKKLKTDKADKKYFTAKFPHYNWN